MTIWFATEKNPLPDTPQYMPCPHTLAGVVIPPGGGTFDANFQSKRVLNAIETQRVAVGQISMYTFGFVKYRDAAGAERSKGFIALYNPSHGLAANDFDYVPDKTAYNFGD
jgi:hypothetical protein